MPLASLHSPSLAPKTSNAAFSLQEKVTPEVEVKFAHTSYSVLHSPFLQVSELQTPSVATPAKHFNAVAEKK